MKTKIKYINCVLSIEDPRYYGDIAIKPEELEEVIKTLSKKLK